MQKTTLWPLCALVLACQPPPANELVCGDGILDINEECDDGNLLDADGCEADCTLPRCQNQIVDPGEQCLAPSDLLLGSQPVAAAIVNLNLSDPAVEIVLANKLSQDLLILDEPSTRLPLGFAPRAIATGDLSGDGIVDLAVLGPDLVQILTNDGAGALSAQNLTIAGDDLRDLAIADLNADGLLDLVVTAAAQERLLVIPQEAAGVFSSTPFDFEILPEPSALAISDLNDDDQLDVVVSSLQTGELRIFVGQGNFSFQAPVDLFAGNGPVDLAVADLDADLDLDLVTANQQGNNLSILFNNTLPAGALDFTAPLNKATDFAPSALLALPIDNNGTADLLVGHLASALRLFPGTGDGNFEPPAIIDGAAQSIFLTALPQANAQPILLSANNTDDIFVSIGGISTRLPIGGFVSGVTVADIDQDQNPDLITTLGDSNTLAVALSDENALFSRVLRIPTLRSPTSPIVADFNKDGFLDVAFSVTEDDQLELVFQLPTGELQRVSFSSGGISPRGLQSLDVNSDGNLDLLVANTDSNHIAVFLNDGAANFSLQSPPLDVPGGPTAFRIADLNNDAVPDIAVNNSLDNKITTFISNANGPLAQRLTILTGEAPLDLIAEDLNLDGNIDLATANSEDDTVSFMPGNGTGFFNTQFTFATGARPSSIVAADIDEDNLLDIIVSNANSKDISVLLYRAGGQFVPQQRFAGDEKPSAMTVFDLDGDGLSEVFLGDGRQSLLRLFLRAH